jgi:YegS/Rv2252/BmrU family lipid kinase
VFIVVNPNAGFKAGLATNPAGLETIEAAVAELCLDCEVVATTGPGDATRLARAAIGAGHDLVVAAGGDGTIREVLPALLGTDVTLGILPIGSAMNVARALDIPRDVRQAAALLQAAERVEPIDLGRVNERLFVEAAGVGITAGVMHLLGQLDAGRWHHLRTLIRYLRLARPHRLLLDLDGQRRVYRTLSVVVANAPLIGAGMPIAAGALMNDGLFDVRVFLAGSKRELAGTWLRIILGRPLDPRNLVAMSARRLSIEARKPRLVHADDELAGRTPATFELLPAAVRVIVGPNPTGLGVGAGAATVGGAQSGG